TMDAISSPPPHSIFHHGIRRRGGTIFRAALPSDRRQVQADSRTHLIHRPARDTIPPLGGVLDSTAIKLGRFAGRAFAELKKAREGTVEAPPNLPSTAARC